MSPLLLQHSLPSLWKIISLQTNPRRFSEKSFQPGLLHPSEKCSTWLPDSFLSGTREPTINFKKVMSSTVDMYTAWLSSLCFFLQQLDAQLPNLTFCIFRCIFSKKELFLPNNFLLLIWHIYYSESLVNYSPLFYQLNRQSNNASS